VRQCRRQHFGGVLFRSPAPESKLDSLERFLGSRVAEGEIDSTGRKWRWRRCCSLRCANEGPEPAVPRLRQTASAGQPLPLRRRAFFVQPKRIGSARRFPEAEPSGGSPGWEREQEASVFQVHLENDRDMNGAFAARANRLEMR
jgi:hypothetical protein